MNNLIVQLHNIHNTDTLLQRVESPTTSELLELKLQKKLQKATAKLKASCTLSTFKAYKQDHDTFVKLIGKSLSDASEDDVLKYIEALSLGGIKKYEPSTIARKVYSISKQFNCLIGVDIRKDNPVKTLRSENRNLLPKQIKRITQPLTLDDIDCILKLKNNKTALLVEALASTGARIFEILDIKTQDIKPESETVSKVDIRGKGNKFRTLFLSNNLIEKIQALFTSESEYLFHTKRGTRTHRVNEHKKIKTLIQRVTGKKAYPHQLRHLYATTQIVDRKQCVKGVSLYLGHSSAKTTLDMYVKDELSSKDAILV